MHGLLRDSMLVNSDLITWLLIGCNAGQSDAKFKHITLYNPDTEIETQATIMHHQEEEEEF